MVSENSLWSRRFSFKHKLWISIQLLCFLYLSDTMGLNTGIIGTLMLVSKFLDGISDVIFGNLIDRTKSKLGKARPWMLYAQIGVSLCLVLLFSIPGGLGTTAQYAYFFAFYTALNAIFYTANGIAYSALSALITRNKNERVQLGSIRFYVCCCNKYCNGICSN